MGVWNGKQRRFCNAVVAFGILSCFQVTAAQAQSLQWGMWGEPPERSKLGSGLTTAALPKLQGPDLTKPGGRPNIAALSPKTVTFANGMKPGSVVIDTAGRRLYYTLSDAQAYVYPIAVGKQGFAWSGIESVSRVEQWPDWVPPPEMHKRKPGLPVRMAGGLNNPLGARAIYLGNTLYRIHGTNDPKSIGSASSSGCFRMNNAHVVHLAGLVGSGTTVYVMRSLPKSGIVMPPAAPPASAVASQQGETKDAKAAAGAPAAPQAEAPAAAGEAQPQQGAPAPQQPEAKPQAPSDGAQKI